MTSNIGHGNDARPVILVGGAPLSGKTEVAHVIGQHLGIPVISTDHLGEAARAVTNPTSHADLHRCSLIDYRQYYVSKGAEQLLDDALLAHRALWPAIDAAIRRHLVWAGPVVIEGWALLPNLVRTIASPRVRAVWIGVPEPVMRSRLQAQSDFVRGVTNASLLIERFVSRSAHMNDWLREEAPACGFAYMVLSGAESPQQVSSMVLEAIGLRLPPPNIAL